MEQPITTEVAQETPTADAAQEVIEEEVQPEEPKQVEEKKEQKVTPNLQKRIDQLTRKFHEEKRLREVAEAQLKAPLPPSRPARPNMTAYTDEYGVINHVAYDQAMVKYEDNLLAYNERQKAEADRQTRQKIEREEKVASYQESAQDMMQKYPDFHESVSQNIYTPQLQDALFDSEKGAEIAYILGKNPEEAIRIGKLSYSKMVKEIVRLEDKVTQELAKVTTKAPPPIEPVDATGGIVEKDPKKMTDEEWFRWKREQKIRKIKKE